MNLSEQAATGIVRLGAVNLPVTEPLSAGWKHGFLLAGETAAGGGKMHSEVRGACTQLYAAYREESPLLTLLGTGAVIKNICLSGNNTKDRSGVTLLSVRKGPDGVGSGKHDFSNLTLANADIGVAVGETLGELNCDNLTFAGSTRFHNLRVGLSVRNQMGQHQVFDRVECRRCDVFAELFTGSDLNVRSFLASLPCTAVHVREPGFGSNLGVVRVDGVDADQHCGSRFKLLQMDVPCSGDFVFDKGAVAYDGYAKDGATLIDAKGPCGVRLTNWRNLQRGMLLLEGRTFKGRKQGPHVVVDGCRMSFSDMKTLINERSKPPYTVTFRDNYDWNGEHFNYSYIERGW